MGDGTTRNHGREAEKPRQVPPRGWLDILWRVKKEIADDNISVIAAGVAFWGMLALFPTLAAVVSIWALFADPIEVEQQVASMMTVLPVDAARIIRDQLITLTTSAEDTASVAAVVGVLLAIYSATKGINGLMQALNVVYGEKEKRGFIELTLTSFALTAIGVVFAVVAIGSVAVAPAVFDLVPMPAVAEWAVAIVRWPILAVMAMTYVAVLYRYGPSRHRAAWRWISPGAVLASIGWLVASAGFSLYVGKFGNYNETYGAVGAVVVLLMWMYISAFVLLLGAEVNSEAERQTKKDTTVGPDRPMGQRGAYVADTVGEAK